MHMAQLMPLPLTVSCFSKIQIGLTFLVPAHPGSPGKRAVKRACVCVCTGGNLAHVVNFFYEQRFPVIRNKIDFPRNFEILFPGSGPRYSYQIFFPDGPWASPCNERKNLAPTPENLAKMGVKFFGGGAISITWGQNCRGRLKSGKGVY